MDPNEKALPPNSDEKNKAESPDGKKTLSIPIDLPLDSETVEILLDDRVATGG